MSGTCCAIDLLPVWKVFQDWSPQPKLETSYTCGNSHPETVVLAGLGTFILPHRKRICPWTCCAAVVFVVNVIMHTYHAAQKKDLLLKIFGLDLISFKPVVSCHTGSRKTKPNPRMAKFSLWLNVQKYPFVWKSSTTMSTFMLVTMSATWWTTMSATLSTSMSANSLTKLGHSVYPWSTVSGASWIAAKL